MTSQSEQPLKILVVTQYFWPENMRINDMVHEFSARGHQVTVLTGLPNYPEGSVYERFRQSPKDYSIYSGAHVVRVPLLPRGKRATSLALNYVSFFISASTLGVVKLRKHEFDAVFVYAVSPIMAAIPAILIGRLKRAPVCVWVLDLWPETLRAVGVVSKPALLRVVGRMVSWIYNRTDYLLLQSHAFFDSVRPYCTRPMGDERLVYFPSWAEDDFSSAPASPCTLIDSDSSVLTVVFAGNLGEAQDFPAILDAAEALRGSVAVRWVIVGDGRMSAWIAEQVAVRQLDNVHLLGRHPLETMPGLFAKADALLVSLKSNDVFEKTIPGKLQAYLASGRPLLGMINGEAARVINQSGAGLVCASGDAKGLANITRQLAEASVPQRAEMAQAGRSYYESNYTKETLMKRLETLLRTATRRKAG